MAVHWKSLAKYRVKREPDRQIEDHADDCGGDPGEGAVQRLVVSELLDERRAEPDPQEARDKGGPGRQQPAEGCPVDDRVVIAGGYVMARAADTRWPSAMVTGAAVDLMLATRLNPLWILMTGGALGGLGLL